MNKKVMQFRYYTDKSKNNYPLGLKKSSLNSGEIFKEFYPIAEINIQGAPNTKFFINNGENSILIGPSGIYHLNLQNLNGIYNLYFDLKPDDNNPLIIDIIYN